MVETFDTTGRMFAGTVRRIWYHFRVGKQKNGRRFQKASFLATEESRYWARHQSDSSHHPHTMKMINPDELSSEVEVVTSCSS